MKLIFKIFGGVVLFIALAIGAVFYFTSGLIDEAESFISKLQERNTEDAYSMLSSEFKRLTSQKEFSNFLTANDLLGMENASWGKREVDMSQGKLSGILTTASGGSLPMDFHFVREDSSWKILGIHRPEAGLQPSEKSQTVAALSADKLPSEEVQVTLVQDALREFGESVNAKDMTNFHRFISRTWQSQYDVAKLDEAYRGLYEMPGDLTKVSQLSPIFKAPTHFDERGVMIISGYFPTSPQKVNFEQKFIPEGTGWKLLGFSIQLTE